MNLGLDIGSRTVKLAVVEGRKVVASHLEPGGFDPRSQALRLLERYPGGSLVSTGYGRQLAQKHFGGSAITEIKAHALGARHFHPGCRTVIDVGGQDAKVIALDSAGRVEKFQMNDKCAAGTGRFLEIMAASLGFSLEEFGPAARCSTHAAPINSMCTVFAESEVVTLKNSGCPVPDIAAAVHLSVAQRLAAMVERLGWTPPVVFTGGVARSGFLVASLSEKLGIPIDTCPEPDLVGAVGAALFGLTAGQG